APAASLAPATATRSAAPARCPNPPALEHTFGLRIQAGPPREIAGDHARQIPGVVGVRIALAELEVEVADARASLAQRRLEARGEKGARQALREPGGVVVTGAEPREEARLEAVPGHRRDPPGNLRAARLRHQDGA